MHRRYCCPQLWQCYKYAATPAIFRDNGGGKDSVGGIAGQCGNKSGTYANSVVSCYNRGAISNPGGRWYGGVAGMADSASTITNML